MVRLVYVKQGHRLFEEMMFSSLLLIFGSLPVQAPPLKGEPVQAPIVCQDHELVKQAPKLKFELKVPPALASYVLHLRVPLGDYRFGHGSACAVAPRRKDGKYDILTAAHLVGSVGNKIEVRTDKGAFFVTTVVSVDPRSDVAWLLTDRSDLVLPMLIMAKVPSRIGGPIQHYGLGGGVLRRGFLKRVFGNRLDMHIQAVGGDSGAPVICEVLGEVIGVQSTNANPRRLDVFGKLDPPHDSGAGSCDAAWKCRPGEGVVAPVISFPVAPPVYRVINPAPVYQPPVIVYPSYVVPQPRIIYRSPPVNYSYPQGYLPPLRGNN